MKTMKVRIQTAGLDIVQTYNYKTGKSVQTTKYGSGKLLKPIINALTNQEWETMLKNSIIDGQVVESETDHRRA